MNDDMSEYLGVFLEEAREQLELLEQDIVRLEQSPSPELLQAIFRAAHTLKGSSRAMGFTGMGELTHALEDVFDQLRHETLAVSGELIDALFAGLDALKAMKDEIAATGHTERDTTRETALLRAALSADEGAGEEEEQRRKGESAMNSAFLLPPSSFAAALSADAQAAVEEARALGVSVYHLKLEVAADSVMKSVRALMTLQALERIGSVLASLPDEEGLEQEAFEIGFEVLLATQAAADEVLAALETVNELQCVECLLWEGEEGVRSQGAGVRAEQETEEGRREKASGEKKEGKKERRKEEETILNPQSTIANRQSAIQNQTVRVDVARLDNLLNLVGELVIDRTRIAGLGQQFTQQYAASALVENLTETALHVGRITDELQSEIMKARMLPLESVFSRFPRMVRDLAQKLGKEVQFVVEGQETELDRSVIEVIGDPLIHMLRNSVDHGVEMPDVREQAGKPRAGTVRLRAAHQDNRIVIEIQDDGRGMDPVRLRGSAVQKGLLTEEDAMRLTDKEALNLIFAPGFSTATVLTDVSGRGVGMDIVRSNLQKLGAQIDIDSQVGAGTTFTVHLPLTLAIIRGLLARVDACIYALPLHAVVEILKIDPQEIHRINHREVVPYRGRTLPLIRLRTNTKHQTPNTSDSLFVVVTGTGEKQAGFVVDALVGEQEVVIKTLGKFIGDIRGIAGGTILGDGRVALIADINGLMALAAEEKAYAA